MTDIPEKSGFYWGRIDFLFNWSPVELNLEARLVYVFDYGAFYFSDHTCWNDRKDIGAIVWGPEITLPDDLE